MDNEKEVLGKLRNSEAIYVPMSECTKMPFVLCDEETFDDEILVFFDEEHAKEECKKLMEQKNPLHSFYSSLLPMGINAIVVEKGTEQEMIIQLSSLITRKNGSEDAQGRPIVENPELQLTALYFMQQLRKTEDLQMTEELKEIQEEMLAHYVKGTYIVAYQEEQGVAILRQKDGKVLQPLFTDIQEYLKFQNSQKDVKFKTAVIEAKDLSKILAKETTGVVVNPYSINLQLQVHSNNEEK